jgi:sulfide:quinone oxidoreductase
VILGCGLGGLVAASTLARKTRGKGSIVVVERKTSFQLPALFPGLMMGWRKPNQTQRDLKALARKKIKIINENVKSIDIAKRRVKTDSSDLSYDHLIVALGAEYAPDDIPGLKEHAHHVYDLESAVKFRDALETFPGGIIALGVSRLPFKCPAAPYEAALLLEDHFRKTGKKATFQFFTPEPHPVPAAGPVIAKQVERLLAERGIQYHPKKKLARVEKGKARFDDGEEIAFDLLFAVPPHKCPGPVVEAGLSEASGWVPVNPYTLATKFDDVYAVGDVAGVETPHGHMPFLPKAGVFARGQAEVVANNIAVAMTGKGERVAWDGTGECFLQVSKGESAFLRGTFLSKPPRLEFHPPRRKWQLERGKWEKFMMSHWF